ncbi:MAG: biotin--[acetyl-CoA-carboxylase] ligase [Maricaulaceae bacterium]
MRFIQLTETASTNNDARELARSGEFFRGGGETIWLRADRQTAGRGRHGRDWVSETGNLFCTGLFLRRDSLAQAPRFGFVAAIAVYDTLKHFAPEANISLKWPNDVLVSGAKTSGLLLETGTDHGQDWMMVGIGINITSHPDDTPYPATHLAAHLHGKHTPSPEFMLSILSGHMDHWHEIYVRQGFDSIREAWSARAHIAGEKISARLSENDHINGEFVGLGANGELRLALADGTIRAVFAADVTFGAR